MKRIILSVVTLLVFVTAASAQKIYVRKIYKKRVSEERTIQNINVATGIKAYVYKVDRASDSGVVLCSKNENLKYFECYIDRGEMTVRYTPEYLRSIDKILDHKNDKYVEIYTNNFEKITATSSANIVVEDTFEVDDLEVKATSSGVITFQRHLIVNGDIEVATTSSGDVMFKEVTAINDMKMGATSSSYILLKRGNINGNLTINGSSIANISIDKLMITNDLKANVSSTAKVNIGTLVLEYGTIALNASSSSDIYIERGEVINYTKYNTVVASSGASIDCIDLYVSMMKVTANSGSEVKASALNNLYIDNVSSGATLYYKPIFGAEVTGLDNISSGGKARQL